MELVDRYLQAVGFWLPKRQKRDIAAELLEDIEAQIAEREVELGRAPTQAEVEGMLLKMGRPVLVAGRYLPQEYLIGPTLFPVYRLVLAIVLLCVLVPTLLVSGVLLFDKGWPLAFRAVWSGLWTGALASVGTATLAFAVLERVQARWSFLEKWSPARLPKVRDPMLIPRSQSAFELAMSLGGLVFWLLYLPSEVISFSGGTRISLAPEWIYFFWGIFGLSAMTIMLAAVKLWRPYWTLSQAIARMALDCAGALLFCWLFAANLVTGLQSPGVSAERGAALAAAINFWTARMLPGGLIVATAMAVAGVVRIRRLRRA